MRLLLETGKGLFADLRLLERMLQQYQPIVGCFAGDKLWQAEKFL